MAINVFPYPANLSDMGLFEDRLTHTEIPHLLLSVGLLTGGLFLAEILGRVITPAQIDPLFLIGALTSVPWIGAFIGAGYWLPRSEINQERYSHIVVLVLVGSVISLGFFTFFAVFSSSNIWYQFATIRWGVLFGGGCSLIVGIFQARSIERSIEAERAVIRAEEMDERRELLDYLNTILRHEVLNTVQIIEGYASVLKGSNNLDQATQEHLDYIQKEAQELETITEDVRILLQAANTNQGLERINLSTILEREVERLHTRYDSVETELDIPHEVSVTGDELQRRIFSNLLSNAVEHNDSDTPSVSVTVIPEEETVSVQIADDGPGIPESERTKLFEHSSEESSNHGLGLSIVAILADRYGGDVELTRTGDDGSVFTVTLPRASDAEGTGGN